MKTQRSQALLEEDIRKLKDWLIKQPHLPQDIDSEIITCFVNGTKTLEIAKQKLDAYLSLRSSHPNIFEFSVRDPLDPVFKKANASTLKFFLPEPTPEGYRVLFNRVAPTFDECFVHSQEIIKSVMMIELAMYKWPDMSGLYLVYDLTGLNTSVLTKLRPTILAAALHWFQGSVPVKMKGVLIFNALPFMEQVMTWLVKPFTKRKLYERIILTSDDNNCLSRYLPEAILPSDYGGTGNKSSIEMTDEWIAQMENNRSWFERTSKQMVDEKKRPPDVKNTYGIEGTFRQLTID